MFNIETHVPGIDPIQDQREAAWVHTINLGNVDCLFCRLVVNAINLSNRDPAVALPERVILKFSVFWRMTEKHRYGGETIYTARRICIFSERNDANADENLHLRSISLIQCHYPFLLKQANKWEFDHPTNTIRSLFSGCAIRSFQINFEQLEGKSLSSRFSKM
jgi:hypothetical protein